MSHCLKKTAIIIGLFLIILCFKIPFQVRAVDGSKELNVPILCYHRIIPNPTSFYDLTPAQLEAHFQYFKSNGYTPITVSQFLEYQKKPALFPEKPIVLTFDDGSKSHYTQVLPMLKKYGFKATFYIFTNAMHGSKERWLTWDEVLEISRSGMDIGSHTLSHPYLTVRDKMSDGQYKVWLEKELAQSKKLLEEKLNIRVNTLAYPFGLYDSEVEAVAIRVGYSGMLSLNMGLNGIRENPFRLKRRLMVNSVGPKSLGNIFSEKVLDLEILSPVDTNTVNSLPVIRFRTKTPSAGTVRLEISKYQASLKPDAHGVYTFEIPGKLRPGFQTIIVRGKDANNNSQLNSWSFYYKPNPKSE
jgi:peptidoglycan/xylan/chitin deacetylase (PgdA/CDA1 family)